MIMEAFVIYKSYSLLNTELPECLIKIQVKVGRY